MIAFANATGGTIVFGVEDGSRDVVDYAARYYKGHFFNRNLTGHDNPTGVTITIVK